MVHLLAFLACHLAIATDAPTDSPTDAPTEAPTQYNPYPVNTPGREQLLLTPPPCENTCMWKKDGACDNWNLNGVLGGGCYPGTDCDDCINLCGKTDCEGYVPTGYPTKAPTAPSKSPTAVPTGCLDDCECPAEALERGWKTIHYIDPLKGNTRVSSCFKRYDGRENRAPIEGGAGGGRLNWAEAQNWCESEAMSVSNAGCDSDGVKGCPGFLLRADTQEKVTAVRDHYGRSQKHIDDGLDSVALWIGLYESDHTGGNPYGDQEWKWVDDGAKIWDYGYGPKNMDPFNEKEEQCAYIRTDCIFDGLATTWTKSTFLAQQRDVAMNEQTSTTDSEVSHHTRCMYDSACEENRQFVCELTEMLRDRCFDYSNLEIPCEHEDAKQRESYPRHTIVMSVSAGQRNAGIGMLASVAVLVAAVAVSGW